jgi:transposase
VSPEEGRDVRTIALDIHKRFAEVAVQERGEVRRMGRIGTSARELRAFADQLETTDHVVVESTAFTWALVELLSERAGRVTVSNPMRTQAIASAKVKTDKVDAKVLAQLGAADFLPEVWAPDRATLALRRQIAHRASPCAPADPTSQPGPRGAGAQLRGGALTDVFGKRARRFLERVELENSERAQLESALRLHHAVEAEVEAAEHSLAKEALANPDVRRLMTIPGVGMVTALAIVSVIGDVRRFPSARQLVGYLGLDPRVRQSGERAARIGRISRQGQSHARGLLIEAAHSAVKTPGPLRAFCARIQVRRGRQVALVAAARKLTVIAWHLLWKQEDYRFGGESLSRRKLRDLQNQANAPGRRVSYPSDREKKVDRRLLEQAERNYVLEVAQRADGAGATKGTRL